MQMWYAASLSKHKPQQKSSEATGEVRSWASERTFITKTSRKTSPSAQEGASAVPAGTIFSAARRVFPFSSLQLPRTTLPKRPEPIRLSTWNHLCSSAGDTRSRNSSAAGTRGNATARLLEYRRTLATRARALDEAAAASKKARSTSQASTCVVISGPRRPLLAGRIRSSTPRNAPRSSLRNARSVKSTAESPRQSSSKSSGRTRGLTGELSSGKVASGLR
mmetsp:Transcript_6829/g.26373  ORF Transcript_6829/g.26373 Transcript_6829/m.26373 type:complete len:221 (+) Transcript_6829:1646-2308(+)